ncbi:hypothetical protein O181_094330 [Austropuccinia psidii MF-1]|uniref:Uncharacterized protein n=1 Tax=Austropuccinia psidii MF-1 TaxID=1389203 RepID=A0A9Q3PAZ5_9BASI|nr:hypothetical protein [Austropuccinia psidii MF-1]
MPVQHSPPARQTRSQAFLTPTPRAPLDGTPAVPQLRAHFARSSTIHPGRKRAKKIKGEENYVEAEESDGTEGALAPVGASQGTGGLTLAQYNQHESHQSEPSLLVIIHQITQIMANLQASRPPAFNTPSMKAPDSFDGTQPFKFRSFIQSCQLIFHNDLQISLKKERKFFMPAHLSLAGLQNGLSLVFPISPIKIQITFSINGNYLNLNYSPYMGTQMKSEKLKQKWIP